MLITRGHPLFKFLDGESRRKRYNWLIFKRAGNNITVTHFGPFGRNKSDDFEDTLDKTNHALKILKRMWDALNSPNISTMSEEEKERERERIRRTLIAKFWAVVQDIRKKIEAKKEELRKLIHRVHDEPADRPAAEDLERKLMDLEKKLVASTGKVMVKILVKKMIADITAAVVAKIAQKVAARIAAKTATKAAAKSVSKGGGKAAVRAVPILGLTVGAVFGTWKLLKGDVSGAGMEYASGAASCIPGVGTAASLAIDVGLVAKEISKAKAESDQRAEDLKAETERIQRELNELYEQLDEAEAEYEYVKEVLEDPGFKMRKLQREISLLEETSDKLCQQNLDS